jgi:hypothetical protein
LSDDEECDEVEAVDVVPVHVIIVDANNDVKVGCEV